MKCSRAAALGLLAAGAASVLPLAGCKIPGLGGGAAPTGQVVATVDGQEITTRELAAEMGNVKTADPKERKAAEMAALNNLLGRKILAKAAIDQGLDKTPDFALQKQRAIDGLLAQTLQAKIASQVPPPTREEAVNFVEAHPDIFAERKVFTVDQIRMARPKDPAVLKAFEPLKTMPDVEAQLNQDHLPFQKGVNMIDALGADPNLIEQVVKLPPGEIFIVPSNGGLLVNQIRDTQVIPFTGDPAVQYAQSLIARQRSQEAVAKQVRVIMGKEARSVKFNKDFAPPRPAAAAKAP